MANKLFKTTVSALLASALLCVPALAVTVEQAQAVMPEIDVYLYENAGDLTGLTEEDVSASLDRTPLEVSELTRSEQGIFYVYMLDVSGSIPAAHFDAAREAVRSAYSRLREQDSLSLIAFGDEVRLLLRGGETRSRVEEALASLTPEDANTKFYEAMDSLVELVSATKDMRRVAVVISDGDDSADDETARAELETTLLESGVSVSALCIDSAASEDAEEFREMIEVSGGMLYTFGPDNAGEVLQGLLDRLAGGWLLCLKAPSNIADGHTAELSMTFGGGEPLLCPVTLDRWTPDTQPPRVKSAVCEDGGGAILVTYSEPVSGAEVPTAYVLGSEKGTGVAVSSVETVDPENYRLLLSAAPGEDDTLTLTVSGPVDASMEQNPLEPWSNAVWTARTQAEEGEAPSASPEPLIDLTTILIMVGAVAVLGGVGFLIVRMTKKKTGPKTPAAKKEKERKKPEKTEATFFFEDKDTKK